MSALLGADYRARHATYDLRRLRLKSLIERIAHTNRYRITDHGRQVATFLTRLTKHVVIPALGAVRDTSRPTRRTPPPLAAAWRNYDREIQRLLKRSGLAA